MPASLGESVTKRGFHARCSLNYLWPESPVGLELAEPPLSEKLHLEAAKDVLLPLLEVTVTHLKLQLSSLPGGWGH